MTVRAPAGTALVTGGAGFIGSALVRRLLAEGHRVVVFDDLRLGRPSFLPDDPRLEIVRGDVRDADALRAAMRAAGPSLVCHLAAIHYIPYCEAHPEEAWSINVEGTRRVLEACQSLPPAAVFLASSAAVYPVSDRPHREDDPVGPVEPYGRTKVETERLGAAFARETGIPTRAGRFFNGFGPRETNPHLLPEIHRQLREGARELRLGSLEPRRDYVFVDDLAEGILATVATAHRAGFAAYNVGTGRATSVREVVEAFAASLGRPIGVAHDPARVRTVERPLLVADASRLRADAGWTAATPFEEGIRRLLDAEPIDGRGGARRSA